MNNNSLVLVGVTSIYSISSCTNAKMPHIKVVRSQNYLQLLCGQNLNIKTKAIFCSNSGECFLMRFCKVRHLDTTFLGQAAEPHYPGTGFDTDTIGMITFI